MRNLAFAALTLMLAAGAAMAEEIDTGEWQLLALNGSPVGAETTFSIDAEGKVAGKAACNRYFGQNKATLPALDFGALGATRMFCESMAEEDAFLTSLSKVKKAELNQDHLLFTGDEGVVMEFVRDRDDKGLNCISCS